MTFAKLLVHGLQSTASYRWWFYSPSYGISFIRLGRMGASRPFSTPFGHRPVLRSSRENHFPINWEYGNTALLCVTVWLYKFLIDNTENLEQISLIWVLHLYSTVQNWQHWDLNPCPTLLLQQFKTDSTGTSNQVQHLYFNSSKLTALGPQTMSNTFTSTNRRHWDLNPSPTPFL